MKRIFVILAALLMVAVQTEAQTCEHFNLTVDQVDGLMKFTCQDCKQQVDYTKWKQKTDMGITVTTPFLNMNADLHNIGEELTIITAMNQIKQLWVMRNSDGKLVYYQDFSDNPQVGAQVSIPWCNISTDFTLVALLNKMETGGATPVTYKDQFAVQHFNCPPFHGVHSFRVEEMANIDEDQTRHPYTRIEFRTDNPDETDIMDADQFIVYRSKTPDFSECEVIGNFEINGYTRKETIDGKEVGIYVLNDTTEEATYNEFFDHNDSLLSAQIAGVDTLINNPKFNKLDKHILEGFYTHPSNPVYYFVQRAVTKALWPTHIGTFTQVDSVNVSQQLASVSKVSLKQNAGWAQTKKVTVKVELANPLPWEYNDLEDRYTIQRELEGTPGAFRRYVWNENARIRMTRYCPEDEWENGKDPAALEYVIDGSEVKWNKETKSWEAEVVDCQALPYTHYYYSAVVEVGGSVIPLAHNNSTCQSSETEANLCYSKVAATINSFTATKGEYPGKVLLKWTLGSDKVDKFSIERRENSRNRFSEWQELKLDSLVGVDKLIDMEKMRDFMDTSAKAGHAYEYRLKTYYTCRNMLITDSATVQGWGSFLSSISGTVTMPNGMAMAGQKVMISRNTPVFIDDVTDEEGNIIMYGYHDGIYAEVRPEGLRKAPETDDRDKTIYNDTILTDELGHFEFTQLPFMGEGTDYVINFGDQTYKIGGIEYSNYTIRLNNELPLKENIKCISANIAYYSGKVVYTESTVPVMDAHFMVESRDNNGKVTNAYYLRTADGELVKSDSHGDFAFTVPAGRRISIRVVKDGHDFSGHGLFLQGTDSIFTPQSGVTYTIPQIQDATRIRLVGRICGGNVEAAKELGFSKSKNNLGDDLTIELQLEGNNTSWLVFKQDKPDDTTLEKTIQHPVKLGVDYQPQTTTTYEKKRIIIKVDPVTGEFFADLIPAKYCVSQVYAMGYPSLYSKGEGLDVIDFGDSTKVKTCLSVNDPANHYDYNATYVRTYHVPATITYEQMSYGQRTGYLGEEKLSRHALTGDVEHLIASYDNVTKTPRYTFGYPVFEAEKNYMMRVTAHEDFYYNNNPLGELDEVPISGGKLHVQNCLLDQMTTIEKELDAYGTATFAYSVGNPTFALSGEDALRSLNISVELNDYYYEAQPMRAFVVGAREVGKDAVPLVSVNKGINLLDILRDPPGSTSYAYREKGTKYCWTRSALSGTDHDLITKFGFGLKFKVNGGLGFIVETHFNAVDFTVDLVNVNLTIPIKRDRSSQNGQYSLTINERIETSRDPLDIGAMSDVYIGTVDVLNFYRTQTFDVIDQATYDLVKTSIENGSIKLVQSGKDALGNNRYIVIGDVLSAQESSNRAFAYSQKHIVGMVIPELIQKRESLMRDCDEATAQSIADRTQQVVYIRTQDSAGYKAIFPTNNPDGLKDEVADINNTITSWENVILKNEKDKVEQMRNGTPLQRYSVAGTSVSYSQDRTAYYNSSKWQGGKSVKGGFGIGSKGGGGDEDKDGSQKKDKDGNDTNNKAGQLTAFGMSYSFEIGGNFSETGGGSILYENALSAGYGFQMDTNDNGYMDVDVYATKDSTLQLTKDQIKWITASPGEYKKDYEKAGLHNFLFIPRGGAVRNPYQPVDYTLYYKGDDGKPVALGERFLKIDNPRIYVEHPTVNNQPEDEDAVIRLRLTNETEINPGSSYLNPSRFKLYLDEASNPNGASIMMDGLPLSGGKDFVLAPGHSVEKTIKIGRGVGHDFNNLKLMFCDKGESLYDSASVSIHYLPVASPISLTMPDNQWTMNTLSPRDGKGYYIPVSIGDFNVNSDGFHHIELQYKKKTDGESKWTCVKAFYSDSTLYAMATGDKEMIPVTGKINDLKFYGEKDPVEMEYDLRAVAFRKLGTGFITRTSAVASGKKDTSCPSIFGAPKPANGILTYADVITIPFNEPIAYNYLDKLANFNVTGRTNSDITQYATALHFPKLQNPDDVPQSKVKRSLQGNDFTVDAVFKLGGEKDTLVIFGLYDSDNNYTMSLDEVGSMNNYMDFGFYDNVLAFYNNGYTYVTKEITDVDFTTFHRVGMTFTHDPEPSQAQVKFYVDGVEYRTEKCYHYDDVIDPRDHTVKHNLDAYGNVWLGYGFHGSSLTDVRLWARALPDYEMAQKYRQYVGNNELGLVGYWPLDEGSGNVAVDKMNGADLYFTEQSWQFTAEQYSLHLDGRELQLRNVENISRPQSYDYTLSLWVSAQQLDGDSVDIFRAGEPDGIQFLRLGTDKHFLTLTTKNNETGTNMHQIVPENIFADQAWHNIIVVGNKSQNTGAIYFDGTLSSTFSGTKLGGIENTNVKLGSPKFHGNLDNIVLWDHAFPNTGVNSVYKRTSTGYEMGLLLNLPFETTGVNEQGSLYTKFSPCNIIYKRKESTDNYLPFDTVMAESLLKDEAVFNEIADKNTFCPLMPATGEQTLDFAWTSTDNGLQIHLKANDADINHQNVSVVVRSVEDLAGNPMQNPQRVVLYVDKNVLKWNDKSVHLSVPYGQALEHKVYFQNISGRDIFYNLHESASWLQLNRSSGNIAPLAEEEVELTISSELAPGQYSTVVTVCDENNLLSQLPITIDVEAREPEWAVTTDSTYRQQMNVIAQVRLKNSMGKEYIDVDKRDIVYAFYDNVCLGKAHVTGGENDAYVYITVKGKQSMNVNREERMPAATISFRLWDASTGNTSFLEASYVDEAGKKHNSVQFAKNATIGSHSRPVILSENGLAMQKISLKRGWNWVSFNVVPYQNEGVNGLFVSTAPFTSGDLINTFEGEWPSVMQSDGLWSRGKDALPYDTCNVYQIYVQKDCEVEIIGREFNDEGRKITLKKTGWNNLAYLYKSECTINEALADYMAGDKAVNGTSIMGRDKFAIVEDNRWYGSLEYLHPGQGYYIYHLGKPGTEIHFYSDERYNDIKKGKKRSKATSNDVPSVAFSRDYLTSMGVVAEIADDVLEDDQLVAYAGEKEIGRAPLQTIDDGRQRFFIMLSADANEPITWAQERDGETIATAKSTIRYSGKSVAGNISLPLLIDFRKGTDSDVIYYTPSGVRATNEAHTILIGTDGKKVVK